MEGVPARPWRPSWVCSPPTPWALAGTCCLPGIRVHSTGASGSSRLPVLWSPESWGSDMGLTRQRVFLTAKGRGEKRQGSCPVLPTGSEQVQRTSAEGGK